MFNIKPIKLLKGSHEETGTTGQGCFMNVVAYLNGESSITDHSRCVDPLIRKLVIPMNDWMLAPERQKLLPYVLRVMGTAYVKDDRRLALAEQFLDELASILCAQPRLAHVAEEMAMFRRQGFPKTALDTGLAVFGAFDSTAPYHQTVDAFLRFLDAACPPADVPSSEIMQRAADLVKLNEEATA